MASKILWKWAQSKGFTPAEIARQLGYESPRYVEQVLRGWEKLTPAFIGRFIQAYPNDAHILISAASKDTDTVQAGNGGDCE